MYEVAELFKVDHKPVRALIDRGELRAVKIGGAWRIAKADIDDYLDAQANRVARRAQEVAAERAAKRGRGRPRIADAENAATPEPSVTNAPVRARTNRSGR